MQRFESTFPVGKFTCRMRITRAGGMRVEWAPRMPLRVELGEAEMRQYRAGRDALLQEMAQALGGSVLVVE